MLSKLHFYIGTLGIIAFLLTGQYMEYLHNQPDELSDGRRMLLRSTHIYLFLTSALNLAYSQIGTIKRPLVLHYGISAIVLIAPLMMLLEFAFGTHSVDEMRIYSYFTLIALFAGCCVQIVIKLINKLNRR